MQTRPSVADPARTRATSVMLARVYLWHPGDHTAAASPTLPDTQGTCGERLRALGQGRGPVVATLYDTRGSVVRDIGLWYRVVGTGSRGY